MSDTKLSFFQVLLENERGFHLLFCDKKESDDFSLYHNKEFAEDPIFNHFIIDETLLKGGANYDAQKVRKVVQTAKSVSRELKVQTSIFIENFWPRGLQFEKTAIELGYRVTDRMEILSKKSFNSSPEKTTSFHFEISPTDDVTTWTEVFMASYSIPTSWRNELLRRENTILQMKNANFLLARNAGNPVGCLLNFIEPKDSLGIYCVGTVPDQRGKGVAREMLAFSEKIALKAGCNLLTLQTLNSDHVSPMYKKIGYRTEFERDILWTPSS
jgi:ribosomal protein S18 acetylase RimI-like enzyme